MSESEGGGYRANNGKKRDDREEEEEEVRASRWDVFREGCVNDWNWLEGEEVAA